jgi:hypothetical protein
MHVLVCVRIHARVQYVRARRVCVFVCACSLRLHQMLSLVDCTAMLSVALQIGYEFLHVQSVEGGNPKICPQCSKQISFFSRVLRLGAVVTQIRHMVQVRVAAASCAWF